jgi:hypothetical protein
MYSIVVEGVLVRGTVECMELADGNVWERDGLRKGHDPVRT